MLPRKNSKIIFDDNFIEYLNDLVTILYNLDYFGFIESAEKYTANIFVFIENNIHKVPHHPAPAYFSRYQPDMKFIAYQASKRTTWYIFFKQSGNRYLIYYISNNHFEGQFIR